MVSIIAPVYNVRDYLARCVQSVLAQTVDNWELLLLDDGSTDGSGALCDAWAARDPRIRVVHKPNEGQGPTRDLGVQHACGEVLAFVDPDDWLEPDFLEVMLAALGDADMVFCDYLLERRERTLTGRRYTWLREPAALATCPQLLYTMGAATWNKLYRRTLWERARVRQPAYAFEDTAAMPLIWLHAQKIVQVRRPLNHYRIDRPESTTNLPSKLPEMLRALDMVINGFVSAGDKALYAPYLAKYCAMALGIPLSRLRDGEEAQRKQAEEFYYMRFPFARMFDEQPMVLLGGLHGRYTLEKTCYLCARFESVPLDAESLQIWSESGFQGWAILDLTSEPNADVGILEAALWRSRCRPVLLESFWPYGHGLYGAEFPFENQSEIEKVNQKLVQAYQTLKTDLPEMPVIRCTDLAFTDTESPFGCRPPFHNNYYYYHVADQLRQILGGTI